MTMEWLPIEGETPIDLSHLKDKSIRTRAALNEAEAENIRQAVVRFLAMKPSKKKAPFTYDWLLKVHKSMFCDVWEWAGKTRMVDTNIGTRWQLIGQELGGLVLDIAAWQTDDRILDQAATIHYRAAKIHPFHNGNGRWARLLANIWLRRHGRSVIDWPEPEIGEVASAARAEYIAAIQLADAGDMRRFTEIHSQYWAG